jgi:hypothetical protein
VHHLEHTHDITKVSHDQKKMEASESDLLHKVQIPNKIFKQTSLNSLFGKSRSAEEWCTRQVVLSGLSLRQISDNEFQEIACSALKLKHFKSAATVGKVVKEFILAMKEDTKKELASLERKGMRFSVVADEWTSKRNR